VSSAVISGENTDLAYTFPDGWSVEVHGIRRTGMNNEFHHVTFALVNSNDEEVYEGEFQIKVDAFIEPPNFYLGLCAVIYTLKQDRRRIMTPGRFDPLHDKPIRIAEHDERVRLWLSMSDEEVFNAALTEISSTPRKGRKYWENAVWSRARVVG